MKPFRTIRTLLAAAALAVAAACTTTTATPNARIEIGISAVTAARTTAATLVTAHRLSAADAQDVQAKCDALAATLQQLRAAPAGDATTAAIDDTLLALQALQAYLATKGAPS